MSLYGTATDSVMLLACQQLTSVISAPPIHPKHPKQSSIHPVGAADPSQLSRTITSVPPSHLLPWYNSKTHSPPSAMAFSTAFSLRAHSSPPFQLSGFIPLLLLLAHNLTIDLYSSPPIPLYGNLGWGRPTGPPACKSTSRRTSLSFSHLLLIWRFRPHLAIAVNIPSPLSSLVQVQVCVRTARNRLGLGWNS